MMKYEREYEPSENPVDTIMVMNGRGEMVEVGVEDDAPDD